MVTELNPCLVELMKLLLHAVVYNISGPRWVIQPKTINTDVPTLIQHTL